MLLIKRWYIFLLFWRVKYGKRPLIRESQTHTRCDFRLLLMINDDYLTVYTVGEVGGQLMSGQ